MQSGGRTLQGRSTLRYVAPFALFMLLLGVLPSLSISTPFGVFLWLVILAPVCFICWPPGISVAPRRSTASIAIGVLVFVIWIGPDLLIPGYRNLPLFSNSLLGHVHSSLGESALRNPWILTGRSARAIFIVPIVEELFWRGWLMRWIINNDFEQVPLGAYAPSAFWITALLFASEHGSYWDVGLVTGVIYNLWMVRTKSLPDCMLTHGVTNGLLSAYVIAAGQWQYWQ